MNSIEVISIDNNPSLNRNLENTLNNLIKQNKEVVEFLTFPDKVVLVVWKEAKHIL